MEKSGLNLLTDHTSKIQNGAEDAITNLNLTLEYSPPREVKLV